AIIVRGYAAAAAPAPGPAPGPGPGPAPAPAPAAAADGRAQITADAKLTLVAASPGAWGSDLRSRIVTDAAELQPRDNSLFNRYTARVHYAASGAPVVDEIEVHRNVSLMTGHARRVDQVLASASTLVRALNFTAQTGAAVQPTPQAAPTAANPLWGNNAGNA